jgi:hypothetical protein
MSFDAVVAELARGLGLTIADGLLPEKMIAMVIGALQRDRVLILLDNLEDVLSSGKALSVEWGQLLLALVERDHQSQVVITSRERPVDLAERGGAPDQVRVMIRDVAGISLEDSIKLLRDKGLKDSDQDLTWIAKQVGGHVQLLTLLANIGMAEYPGYLREHPNLVTDKASLIVNAQLDRQTQEARSLLRKMCVLRSGINTKGLTFLRLYKHEQRQDVKIFGVNIWKRTSETRKESIARAQSVSSNDQEIFKTQAIVDQLVRCCLVEVRSGSDAAERFYNLHNVVSESVKSNDASDVLKSKENAYLFYRSGMHNSDSKILGDLQPLLEAQHFALQLEKYSEAWSLVSERIEKYLTPWGHLGKTHILLNRS